MRGTSDLLVECSDPSQCPIHGRLRYGAFWFSREGEKRKCGFGFYGDIWMN